jgi:hypothetical protein
MAAANRPVELVWSHLKRSLKINGVARAVFTKLKELEVAVLEQIRLLEKDPKLVQAFFRKKEIGFIIS